MEKATSARDHLSFDKHLKVKAVLTFTFAAVS